MNKGLIDKSVKLEKQLSDSEKKINESSRVIKKLKEEIEVHNEIMKQRDDQIKNVIKRVKIQENENSKLLEEIKKKTKLLNPCKSAKKKQQWSLRAL